MRVAILAFVVACGTTTHSSMAPPHSRDAAVASPGAGPYYERVKSAVYGEWQPSGIWKALPPDERAGPPVRVTIVHVEMLPDGSLQSVNVKESSGVPTLDQECVRAFSAAAPFPNPPPQLFENNLWVFDFTFEFDVRSPAPP